MKRVLKAALAASLLLPLFGCGQIQINELAIVTAVGIDPGEKEGCVRMAVQIVRAADARGQTGAPSGGTGEPIYSISAEGETIFEAIRNLARFSSRRVYWAHNFVIVLNEKYARKGIGDMIDFFTRNPELRMNTWVVVTPDAASEVISTVTGLEVVPGEAIDKLFRYNEIVGEAPSTNMMRLFEAYMSKTSQPVLAKLQLKKRGISNKKPMEFGSVNQVELSGAAVFKGDKMVGWLTSEETRGLLLLLQKIDSSVEALPCPGHENSLVTLELKKQRVQVTPTFENGRPGFSIKVDATASIVEAGKLESLEEVTDELQKSLEEQIRKQLQAVTEKAQHKYRSDFLKFGEVFNNKYPLEWRSFSDNWDEAFTEAEIVYHVKARIDSSVLKLKGNLNMKGGKP
ncbi:MAG: germination protein Ger(x)C family [Paenibacillaceae bacterium]|jgi:spore germination protein KC|nr:germination protein Ger(x)C family [Paenibacillaceae bacterium]